MFKKKDRLITLLNFFSSRSYWIGLAVLILFFSSFFELCAQSNVSGQKQVLQGVPGISHYTRDIFDADPQFWAVCEDKDGVLYFGNNDGAVIFDGERWYKVILPNNSSIRCLTTDGQGNVYAGGFNEFGLIKKDDKGQYFYSSLIDTLKFEDHNLENLWQVHILDDAVIYRSFSKLIIINGNKITKLPAKSAFVRSYIINNNYFVQDRLQGIFLLDTKKMQFIPYFESNQFNGEEIVAILPTRDKNQPITISRSGNVYRLDLQKKTSRLWKSIFQKSASDQIECAINANDSTYYLGTLSSGIISFDKEGQIFRSEPFFEGLQDKTVLNLYKNKSGNIWALLNNGLDCINFNSPVTTIFENASLYDVLIQKGKMYLATNQGIFYTESVYNSRRSFKKLNGLEGQGWTITSIEGDVLAGHDKGLFLIENDTSTRIGNMAGVWKIIPVKAKKGVYLAASYNGLYVIKRSAAGKWEFVRKIEGFDESSRDILETETPGTFWVCHGYKGVFRINIDKSYERVTSLEHFTTQNGFIFPYSINVFEWKGDAVFTTNHGIYTYNHQKNAFLPYEPLNSILDSTKNTRKIIQYQQRTWFVQDDEVGYFDEKSLKPQTEYFLQFKGSFNRGMECIIPLPNDQVLLGTKTGLYLFDLRFKNQRKNVATTITSIKYAAGQHEQWLPLAPQRSSPVALPNNTSFLRFEFATPALQNDADIQFSYKLENIDDNWSPWQNSSYTEYNHLRPGSYHLRVKSRSLLGIEGTEATYRFEILPVWYQTAWAWVIYLALATLGIVSLVYLIQRKISRENQKTREEEQKARKLLELELQQMRLKSEKIKISQDKELLEEDIIHKSKELANYTMLLVKKREVISELREDLKELRELAKNDGSRKKVREMISKISQHMTDEGYLHVFEANFEKVHQDFFKQLKTTFPDLTQKELRLCAFVKMNLSNKEIAPMLNISVRGVETSRYRIRKKLNLEYESNLVEYLENLVPDSTRIIT